MLAPAPPVVLLDEPTRGLDYPSKDRLVVVLRQLADTGHAVVVATHDVELVARVADRAVVLADGEVVADGPARDVVCHSPVFAPQVAKVLAPEPWLTVDEVRRRCSPGARRELAPRRPPARRQPAFHFVRGASVLLGAASLIGLVAFCWPLFVHAQAGQNTAHSADAPWVFLALVPLLLAVVVAEISEGTLDAKAVALLGILAACGAALRIPSPGIDGFEPLWFLVIPAGTGLRAGLRLRAGGLDHLRLGPGHRRRGAVAALRDAGRGLDGAGAGCLPAAERSA